MMKKQRKKSVSQKKFKDYSEQIKKRRLFGKKPLHVRNKSSATLIENKFVSRIRPKKIKKISLNDQRSMHSEILTNLREKSYRYIPKHKSKNYFQNLSKKKFKFKRSKNPQIRVDDFNGEINKKENEDKKDLQIKEYEPYIKSVETECASHVNHVDHIQLKEEIFGKGELDNKFASHHELFDQIKKSSEGIPKQRKPSLLKNSERNSIFNESVKAKHKRREHSEPKELIKKNLQYKKQSGYKKSVLNYTKPKNKKIKRKKDKKYLKDYTTLRAGESFKLKEKFGGKKKEFMRGHGLHKKKNFFQMDKKIFGVNLNSPFSGTQNKNEEKSSNSMALNPIQIEGDKKSSFIVKKQRHYIVNDILEKKGFDLNILSNKNGRKNNNNGEFIFRGKNQRKEQKETKEQKEQRKQSKSVKISLNNIRSSVAHLEKALAKEKNRLKNICNLTKNTKKASHQSKIKKTNKKKHTIHKHRDNVDTKSPNLNKIMETKTFEEGTLKKKIILEKKKKKIGKLSTKNLLNKFNKMSYFEFKKNLKGKRGERTAKRNKKQINNEEKLQYEDNTDFGNYQISKNKKNPLYER